MTVSTATLPADGLYPDLDMATYRAWDAWGSSDLRAMRVGPPAMVPWRRSNPSPDTDDTRRGSAAHCLFLTPSLFASTYAHKPEGLSFASKEGKAWRDGPEAAGKVILGHDEWVAVHDIVDALLEKRPVMDLMSDAPAMEASILWTCPITGERLKGRPDIFTDHYVVDLKVSRHAAEQSVAFRAYVEGWMSQLAHYRAGLNAVGLSAVNGGRLIVVGPKPPHALRVYCVEVKGSALDVLALENEGTVKRLHECRVAGAWPGTPDEWFKVDLPATALETIVALSDAEEV